MNARTIGIAAAALLLALVGWRIAGARQAAKGASIEKVAEAPLIRTTKVARSDFEETVTFTGNVKPKNEVDVFAKLPGRIDALQVQVGDKVKAGQLLATVEHKEVQWQAKSAEAAVQAAKAGLQVATAGHEGAKLEFDRTAELAKGGSAPQAALDGARVKLQLAEAQLAQARAGVAQASAALGLLQQQLQNSRLESPIAGVVTRRLVNLGAMASQQMPAFTVQDASTLKLETSVDAAQFARLEKGAKARVTIDGLSGEEGTGTVTILAPTLDPLTRRAAVEIAIDNRTGQLLPHLFAKATVDVGTRAAALIVPREAVLEAAGGAVVYRVRAGKVEAVRPTFGPSDEKQVTVEGGLAEGDELAVTGLGNLSDGAAVKVATR
ncbi:MAG: Macrolide-specific efflux protein MacA precursor [Pseudomonadota bacterium]|jgi:RND family efflux transporter MFP subunit